MVISLSFQIAASRWGGVARRGMYRRAMKTARTLSCRLSEQAEGCSGPCRFKSRGVAKHDARHAFACRQRSTRWRAGADLRNQLRLTQPREICVGLAVPHRSIAARSPWCRLARGCRDRQRPHWSCGNSPTKPPGRSYAARWTRGCGRA